MMVLDSNILLSIGVMLFALTRADAQTAITNANFKGACTAWVGGDTSTYGPIAGWDTSSVTDMAEAFDGASSFNDDINLWDTSNVKTFYKLFNKAHAFNQDIGNWVTSSVMNMDQTFGEAHAFNQDIGAWDTSKVNTTFGMFYDAPAFNQDISGWNVSSVTNMGYVSNESMTCCLAASILVLGSSYSNRRAVA
jgi:surface protein